MQYAATERRYQQNTADLWRPESRCANGLWHPNGQPSHNKSLVNSVMSTPGVRFVTIDIKDFYLNTPLYRPEYLRMKLSYFPEDVIEHYKLKEKIDSKG